MVTPMQKWRAAKQPRSGIIWNSMLYDISNFVSNQLAVRLACVFEARIYVAGQNLFGMRAVNNR